MEFKKYVGIGEYIFVLRNNDKWVKIHETYRDYHSKKEIFKNYDEMIKDLLLKKINEL